VPRCGHLPHLDQPRLVRDQLIALQSHDPSP
jgi:pimeloyl-ACP methyl ester carboxylesterase